MSTFHDSSLAIEAVGLSKMYRIWRDPAARLKYPIKRMVADLMPARVEGWIVGDSDAENKYFRDFYALRDVSFSIRKGEAVGIVGRNGSGKSTLLQMIAGTLTPTHGRVACKGRIAALLELGSGFNPEFTGRENVYLNASVLGLSTREVDERFDRIVAFADIGDFINQPVRTYSSGMVVRLAFAVAAHVDPEILIIDEALSVGDARFQLKCAKAIDRFIESGATILFVSHDTTSVKRLCNRAILLDGGRQVYSGIPNDVVNLYSKLIAEGGSVEAIQDDIRSLADARFSPSSLAGEPPVPAASEGGGHDDSQRDRAVLAKQVLDRAERAASSYEAKLERMLRDDGSLAGQHGQEFTYGGELGRIESIKVMDAQGMNRLWFSSGEAMRVVLEVSAQEHFAEPIFAMTIKNTSGVEVYGTNTLFSGQPAGAIRAGERRSVEFAFDVNLMPGEYFLSLGFTHFFGDELMVVHRRYDACKLEIHAVDRTFGIANLHARISVREGEA